MPRSSNSEILPRRIRPPDTRNSRRGDKLSQRLFRLRNNPGLVRCAEQGSWYVARDDDRDPHGAPQQDLSGRLLGAQGPRRRRRLARGEERGDLRTSGPQRRRQDHHHQDAGGVRASFARRRDGGGGAGGFPGPPAAPRLPAPEPPPLPGPPRPRLPLPPTPAPTPPPPPP